MHIIVRGIGRQILFEDTYDRERYMGNLKKYSAETGVIIFAYCLMDNHVHLLVRDDGGAAPAFMKKMGVSYAQYYNLKYGRTGHLFQDRYKSEVISDDAYLLIVFRYILNNPQKAGICRAEEYPWSSYREYGRTGGITDTTMLCEMIGGAEAFRQFVRDGEEPVTAGIMTAAAGAGTSAAGTAAASAASAAMDEEPMEAETRKKDDAWALEMMRRVLHVRSGTELQQYGRAQRDEALVLLKERGLSVRQIERITGINRGVVQKAKKVVKENRPH